ncbi:MAG: amidohydrolase [Clostridia bacterium]|nr:amidohydrolase [Clostridia bacterium]
MDELFSSLFAAVDAHRPEILAAERHIWKNPEPGYREWKTHKYLKGLYEALGYRLTEAGNIPGFYTEIDTGRPGPTVVVFGEMDSLIIPSHPECDPETGAVHACGHHCQSAALYGVAAALKAPGALDGLCGKIRLIAVPAEELIEMDFRQSLKEQGVIRYFGGKVEFMYRGYLDGADMAMMVHTGGGNGIGVNAGSNGCIIKRAEFIGRAVHAAGPSRGLNALYAANTAMTAANAVRETFPDSQHVRFHPIITAGGTAVNSIPDSVVMESQVRADTVEHTVEMNTRINRAFAGAAAAMGCKVRLSDRHGYAPRFNDPNFSQAVGRVGRMLIPEERVRVNRSWETGCSDMGDVSTVMPAIHPGCGGASGTFHGKDFAVPDPEMACVTSAKLQVGILADLLGADAAVAKQIVAEKKVVYNSTAEYFAAIDKLSREWDAVEYGEDGAAVLRY